MKEIAEKLIRIQAALTVPKDRFNEFGGFHYRNGDDILKAAKPLCQGEGLLLMLTDSMIEVGGRVYVKASAILTDGTDDIKVDAFAREEEKRPKMADPMLTGSASTYARKYAMNGLFGLDDDSDPDNLNNSHIGARSQQPSRSTGNTGSTGNGGPGNDLRQQAEDFLNRSGWSADKVSAMKKNLNNPAFCKNLLEGKIS